MVNRRALTVLLLVAAALPARAADQLLPGSSLVLRQRPSGAERAAFVVRDSGFAAPAAGGPDDPRTVGASLEIRANSGESATLSLPSSGWSLNNAGTAYRYQGGSGDDVKVSILRDGARLKIVARTTGITLDEPSQVSVALIFKSGGLRVCATFGGTIVADVAGRFVARHSTAPGACPAPPSTTSTSSTSTSTSTTSSTTLVGLCGNSTINTGEQCDPPGLVLRRDRDLQHAIAPARATSSTRARACIPSRTTTSRSTDPSTDTGRRVHFAHGRHAEEQQQRCRSTPIDYNRNDGFSPGASMLLHVPSVDLADDRRGADHRHRAARSTRTRRSCW